MNDNFEDLLEVVETCRDLRSNKEDWVVLDTETTGLSSVDEIVEIAIISKYGSTMFETLIKPTIPCSEKARSIHQISDELLENAPTFPEVFTDICRAIAGKKVVIYNAQFDIGKLKYQAELHGLKLPEFEPICAMNLYSIYYGEYSSYWGNYKWQKLPGGSHRAHGDAYACWNLIKMMSQPLCENIYPDQYKKMPFFPPVQIFCNWKMIFVIRLEWGREITNLLKKFFWVFKIRKETGFVFGFNLFKIKYPKFYLKKSPPINDGVEALNFDDEQLNQIPF